jgi:hypothetical protein
MHKNLKTLLLLLACVAPLGNVRAQSRVLEGDTNPISIRVGMTQNGKLSATELDRYLEQLATSLKRAYTERGIDQEQADRQVARVIKRNRDQQTPRKLEITFRSDGSRFIYIEQENQGSKDVFSGPEKKLTVWYDGEFTYELFEGNSFASVSSGRNARSVLHLPLPGVSMGGTALIQGSIQAPSGNGLVEGIQVASTKRTDPSAAYSYVSGVAKTELRNGLPVLTFAATRSLDKPREEWAFFDYRDHGPAALADRFTWTEYVQIDAGKPPTPLLQREFRMLSVETKPIDSKEFRAANFLQKGFTLREEGPDGKPLQYPFDPNLTIPEMRKHQEVWPVHTNSPMNSDGSILPLVFGCVIVSSIVAGWRLTLKVRSS